MNDALDKKLRTIQLALVLLAVSLCIALPVSIAMGPMDITTMDTISSLGSFIGFQASEVPQHVSTIIDKIRLPRAILSILVGAALAVSGAAIQGLFRNPLADPGLIGVSGGAAFAAVGMIVLGNGPLLFLKDWLEPYSLVVAAFIGGFITTLLVAKIATNKFGTSIVTMLLAGLAINIITGSGIGIFTYLADDNQLRTLTFWSMGSLGGSTWEAVIASGSLIMLAIILIPLKAKSLNALLLGESEARHLGVNVNKVKRQVILLSALAVGAAVAVAGMIGFVGLIVPHLIRMSLGPDHRYLLPASAMLGGLFLLCADMISRTMIAPAELPIGLITSIIGGPFFIALIMFRAKRFSI